MRILGFLVLLVALARVMASTDFALYSTEGILCALVGLPLTGVMVAFGGKIGTAFRAVFTRHPGAETLRVGIAALEWAKSFSVGGGVAGTLIGAVLMLKFLNDPAALGPGMSLMYCPLGYAVVAAYGVYGPLADALRQKLAETADQ